MREITFRTCTEADLFVVQQLVNELYQAEYGATEVRPDIKFTFNEFANHPDKGKLVLFELEKKVVGYVILVFFWSNEFRGDVIEIDEMFVDDVSRNLGIGTRFFTWLQTEYKASAAALSLQVAHANKAQNLYERQGFELSHRKHMLKMLNRENIGLVQALPSKK